MAELMRMEPFSALRSVFDWPTRTVFDLPELLRRELPEAIGVLPVDVYEEGNHIVVEAAVPGLKREDIHINVVEGVLELVAERKLEKKIEKENYYLREYRQGKFSRSLRLPPEADAAKADAKYVDGMIKVIFPKKPMATSRTIPIEVH